MSDLSTTEEYRAIAASLDLPQNAFIDGGFRPAISGGTFTTLAGQAVADYAIPEGYFQRTGKINAAASQPGLDGNTGYAAHLRELNELNEPHEMLDAKAMRAVTGTGYYKGGLYTPGTAMLQPAGYVQGFATGLERDGVRIYENSPVTRIESGNGWRLGIERGSCARRKSSWPTTAIWKVSASSVGD